MLAGHYAAALAARRVDDGPPLWVLFVAVQLVDIAFSAFVLLDVEQLRIVDGFTETNALDFYYFPFSHGLPATLAWVAAGYLGARYLLKQSSRTALIVALAVGSHWVLDLIVHTPDLPLLGDSYKVGFGLWDHLVVALLLELAFIAVGLLVYLRSTNWKPGADARRVLILVGVLFVAQAATPFLPAPSSPTFAGATGLGTFLALPAVAWWAERGRRPGAASSPAAG